MADTNNRRAPRVPPGSTSLAIAFATMAERNEAASDYLRAQYERVETMIAVLNRSQLFDHADNWNSIRLGAAMFTLISGKMDEIAVGLDTIERAEVSA